MTTARTLTASGTGWIAVPFENLRLK